jgi:voltage-gated potassium channel
MRSSEERAERSARKHSSRVERMETRVDSQINRKGLRPRYAAYLVIAAWLIAVIIFGIVQRIADPDTYPTIWLAWWWAIQTVTTVGYGDAVPQNTGGKVVASFLMIGGLSLISILTATITSSFVTRRQEKAQARGDNSVMQEVARLSAEIGSLRAELRHTWENGGEPGSRPEEPPRARDG